MKLVAAAAVADDDDDDDADADDADDSDADADAGAVISIPLSVGEPGGNAIIGPTNDMPCPGGIILMRA